MATSDRQNPLSIASHRAIVHGRINLPPTADAPDAPRFDPTEAASLFVEQIGTISSADLGKVRVRVTLTVEHCKSNFLDMHVTPPKARLAIHVLDTREIDWKELHHRTFDFAFLQAVDDAARSEGDNAVKRRDYPGTCYALAIRRLMREAESAAKAKASESARTMDPTKTDMAAAWNLALALLG